MPSSEIIARNTMWWSNEVDRLEAQVASLRNDINTYNETLAGLKDGELTWDRIQIMETGQLRVIPPAPPAPIVPDTCVEDVSKGFGKKNGKRPETALEGQEMALVEVGNGA